MTNTERAEKTARIPPKLAALLQFVGGPVWDGDLLSKTCRYELEKAGYVERESGFTFLTAKGVRTLVELGLLTPNIEAQKSLTNET